ncbi:uncharacterized protein BP01DRAFT_376654 [Aspergillus saccharolyticus JOP 1030-1]|uniref:NAD(P)-binding protein n=1 Tax=Aspergillus saccharolyticus JOP 1030-1 TaxID=1450539 RepID=A0A318Z3R3_9EURO|nr:hypothetical protein BP01DRAFT_376654 [Aspergillus saccharolyticus JOP 1030-1]PYH41951.1 hypothetical protein BP01DRAFT_376654 [Aspergillus saccharolyticus JOP 1030-1]
MGGGYGGVGRTILEVLKVSPKHQTVVLSRKKHDSVQVDYGSIDNLVSVLETHDIHTVICCFAVEGDSLAILQLNLIQAAINSTVTRRFVPSGFAIPYPQEVAGSSGDGETPVTSTYTFDLARYVVAMLDVKDWPEESRVVGDPVTWHEFVKAEEIRSKFEIIELPRHQTLYEHFPKKAFQWFMSIFELLAADGSSFITREGSPNERFPDMQPLTVREMLERLRISGVSASNDLT